MIQSFDPRKWIIFYGCFLASTVLFRDFRYQAVLFIITAITVATSGIKFSEMKRAWIFIGSFVVFFSLLTFLTGRGGVELYVVRKLAPLIVPVTIHAIISSEDIIDAMDLRAFGVGPCTWLEQLVYRKRDRLLIAFGIFLIGFSIGLSLLGFGKFWVPQFLLAVAA